MRKLRHSRGFTMVELMIVVGIIGILASIAIPGYQRLTARGHRTEMEAVLSKLRLYFKNLYDSQGTFETAQTVAAGNSSAINPDPALAAVGLPASWDSSRAGWVDIPFGLEGGVKMRYWYTLHAAVNGKVSDVDFNVCGSFPGFGPNSITCASGLSGNYLYQETFHGNGSSDKPPIEMPYAF